MRLWVRVLVRAWLRCCVGWLLLAGCAGIATAQANNRWWLGFADTNGRVFLELPNDARLCAARDALVKRATQAVPGSVVQGPLKAEAQVPPNARLGFGATDLAGRHSEHVLTRVSAVVRDDVARQGPCWFLAEAGTDTPGYMAQEDRLVIGTHPPRKLAVRAAPDNWKSYGGAPADAPPDARFKSMDGLPPAWRERVAALMPQYTQVFGQEFSAVLSVGGVPENLTLIGAINDTPGAAGSAQAYNTLNLIVRNDVAAPLFQSGPSGGTAKNRAGSFVAQAVAAVDLDGDGIDEIVLRARYFEGGNLKVLKFVKGRLVEIRQTAYEGE